MEARDLLEHGEIELNHIAKGRFTVVPFHDSNGLMFQRETPGEAGTSQTLDCNDDGEDSFAIYYPDP